MELKTTITGSAEVVQRFQSAPARVRALLQKAVAVSGAELQGKVKAEKLTGQVLHVVTGRLRRSVNLRLDSAPEVLRASVGTNVAYGRFWELGYSGIENVRAHVRTIGNVRGGKDARRQGVAFVRAHTRQVNVAPRPFLAPSLAEERPRFMERVRAAATEGV